MVLPVLFGGSYGTSYQTTNSLLFRGGQKLYRAFTSSATWGLSAWVRRSALGTINPILGAAVRFNANDTLTAGSLTTTTVYRDPTAWMHIAVASGHLWVNGVDMGATSTSAFTCSATNCLGYDGTNYLNAEIVEFAFTDGAQPLFAPGRTDGGTGSWVPSPVSAAWGTNGVYLGKPWFPSSLGTDYSGLGNDWTPSGFFSTAVLTDTPNNVFCAMNPLDMAVSPVMLRYDNLNVYVASVLSYDNFRATHAAHMPVYFEFFFNANGGPENYIGMVAATSSLSASSRPNSFYAVMANGNKWSNAGSSVALGSAYVAGDSTNGRGMCAFDPSTGKLWFGRGGAWFGSGDPAAGTNPAFTLPTSSLFMPHVVVGYTLDLDMNFGQREFAYTPPTGFKAISTANLTATSGVTSNSFTGNGSSDGPCVYTGAVPQSLTINGNAVTWGTHADKLATGFKVRTSSTSYNSTGTNNWVATYSTPQKPTVGANKVPSNAQGNP